MNKVDLPTRIWRRRVKGWRLPTGAVCVTRGTIFGNPWVTGNPGRFALGKYRIALSCEVTPDDALGLYEGWLLGETVRDKYLSPKSNAEEILEVRTALQAANAKIWAALPGIAGRPLACFCPPGASCHADVLIRLAACINEQG